MSAEIDSIQPLKESELPIDSNLRLVEYAAFMGGGAKGAGVAGVLDELENAGILPQLTEVAGSSVGSIVATLLAVGYTPKQIKALLLVTVDMILLQDKVEAGWLESTFLSKMTKALTAKLEELGDQVKDIEVLRPLLSLPHEACKVASTIIEKGEKIGEIGELVLGEHMGLWKGEVLSHLMKRLIKQKTGVEELTFKELAELADSESTQFKKLHITGTNITDGVLEYFNASNTPDMPIHLAVRISASYPGAFIPVILKDKDREKMFVDGGYLENLPMIFNRPPYLSSSTPDAPGISRAAIAVVFQSEAEEKTKKELKGKKDAAAAFLATPLNQRQNFNKFAATIRIDPLEVTAMDFDLSESRKKELIDSGAKGTRKEIRLKSKPINFQELTLKELARLKGQFSFQISILEKGDPNQKLKVAQEKMNELNKVFDLKMKQEKLNKQEIEEIIRKEYRKFKMIHENKGQVSADIENADSLEQTMLHSKLEFDRVIESLREALHSIKTMKKTLITGKALLLERMKQDRNFFKKAHQDYTLLSNLHRQLQDQKHELEKVVRNILEKKEVKANMEKRNHLKRQIKEHEKAIKSLLKSIRNFYKDPQSQLDPLSPVMLAVYDAIEHQIKIAERLPQLPELENSQQNSYSTIANYLNTEISELTRHEQACLLELQDARNKQETFDKFQLSAKTRAKRAESYDTLIQIRDELDRAIIKKTNFVAKMYGKASRKNSTAWSIAYRLTQGLAVVCMVATVIPVVGVIVGKCITKSKNPQTRRQGERIVEFFDLTDTSAKARLDTMAKVVADFIQTASQDYNRSTQEESTIIYKLFQQYLKQTGLELQDIVPKVKNESDKTYQARLQGLSEKLKKFAGPTPPSTKSAENSQEFVQTVQEFLKSESKLQAKVKTANIQLVSLEKMKMLEKADQATRDPLPMNDLKIYIQSAIELKKPFAKKMLFNYAAFFIPILENELKAMKEKKPQNDLLTHTQKLLQAAQDEVALRALEKSAPKEKTRYPRPLLIQKRKGLLKVDLKKETSPKPGTPEV